MKTQPGSFFCPHCGEEIQKEILDKEFARRGGLSKSEAKTKAVRENGKKGGRPKKKKTY